MILEVCGEEVDHQHPVSRGVLHSDPHEGKHHGAVHLILDEILGDKGSLVCKGHTSAAGDRPAQETSDGLNLMECRAAPVSRAGGASGHVAWIGAWSDHGVGDECAGEGGQRIFIPGFHPIQTDQWAWLPVLGRL